jgi:hypothetical protein
MTELVDELYRKPRKDRGVNAPRFQSYEPNVIQQGDLLFLPDDGGYKYLLVVVDLGSKLTDAVPIKDKSNASLIKAFQKLYSQKILSKPKQIEFDSGTEFMGTVKKWLEDQGIYVKAKKPHRHRQQGMVERRNQSIGKALFKRMTAEELLTGHPSTQWTNDLKDVLQKLNNKQSLKKTKVNDDYQCKGDACLILSEGTKVRVALDAPIDVATGKRLHGKFRETDIRYEIKPKEIKQVILQPNEPPLYLVSDAKGQTDHRQAYTKNQLLPVKADEQQPSATNIRPVKTVKGKQVYLVEKILDKKKENNRIYFLIKWKGFPSSYNSWEPRSELIKDIPILIKEFEKSNNK